MSARREYVAVNVAGLGSGLLVPPALLTLRGLRPQVLIDVTCSPQQPTKNIEVDLAAMITVVTRCRTDARGGV